MMVAAMVVVDMMAAGSSGVVGLGRERPEGG